jgi:hypothetical protein
MQVKPVCAGVEPPGAPGGFVVEFGDKLQQAITGRVDLRAQVGDFALERIGAGQGIDDFGHLEDAGDGIINGQLPCCYKDADYTIKLNLIREL